MIGVRVSERAAVADVGAARWERLRQFGMPEGRVVKGVRVFDRDELAESLDAMLQTEARAAAARRRAASQQVPAAVERAWKEVRALARRRFGI
jgi:hypothetical protein